MIENDVAAPKTPHASIGCIPVEQLSLMFRIVVPGSVETSLRVSRALEGPVGFVHGGVIATLLDEAMSKANHSRDVYAVTRRLEVEYLCPAPTDASLSITAVSRPSTGRRSECSAELSGTDGVVFAKASALFITVRPDRFGVEQKSS